MQRLAVGALATAISVALLAVPMLYPSSLSAYFYLKQDLFGLLAVGAVAAAAWIAAPRLRLGPGYLLLVGERRGTALAGALAMAGLAYLGTRWIFGSTPVSYDEVQANFDALSILSGHLATPVPQEWRAYVHALSPAFLLEIPGNAAWASNYWPVHAGLRALAAATVGIDWSSPLLAGVAAAATFRAARKLWPERPDAAVVATLLLVTSPQVLVTAMTPYAMTAHLAFNMVWLNLFLADRRSAHAGALAVGALAIGLHQVVFHALFAAPFIVLLAAQRRFRLAAVYAGGYAVVGLAWLSYPTWLAMSHLGGSTQDNPVAAFLARWGGLASQQSGHHQFFAFAWYNLARLVAWLNPALVVLFAAGLRGWRSFRPVEVAIGAGVLFTGAAMMLILPYQGHGWGYRYIHGQVGCMALVAALGWIRLSARLPSAAGGLIAACGLSLAVLLPLNAHHARSWTAPIRDALEAIRSAPEDVVLVDSFPFSIDLVRNRPDLSNRPVVMALGNLSPEAVARICATRSVALLDRRTGARFGMPGTEGSEETPSRQRVALDRDCRARRL